MRPQFPDETRPDLLWLAEQRERVLGYLEFEGVEHGGVPDDPDWFVAPYVAVWRVTSPQAPNEVGWWAISGDMPTDYISSSGAEDALSAAGKFANNWRTYSEFLLRGQQHPGVSISGDERRKELGGKLWSSAELLSGLAGEADDAGDTKYVH
jgi:hypothetical protein